MTFVTAGSDRARLERLTKLLVSSFPGSTIYQHTDPLRVPHDVLSNRVNAVFLEAEMEKANGIELMRMLHRQKPETPVFILAGAEAFCEEAAEAGAAGYILHPVSEQILKEAMLSVRGQGDGL